jgi:AraC-like DNA-binding protein
MVFLVDARPSDSPFVKEIWRANSERAGSFVSIASTQCEMVVTRHDGRSITLTVRGPETLATPLSYPADREWFGIRFKLGTVVRLLPAADLVDRGVNLPAAGSQSFWLQGAAWQFPDYENADTFVDRLVREGLLLRDPVVEAALHGQEAGVSVRSVQRRFVQATGLTQSTIRQIERARHAMTVLHQGASILDVVHEAGYYDQAHLTRSLKRWLGQTPAQIIGTRQTGRLSFLSKTSPNSALIIAGQVADRQQPEHER